MKGNISEIVSHEFSDYKWGLNTLEPEESCDLSLYEIETLTDDDDVECHTIEINEDDARAIAKHFKLI